MTQGKRRSGDPDPNPPTTHQRHNVTRLKHQIALGEYRVDAAAVAQEILNKLRLLSLSRRALLGDEPDQPRQRPDRS